LGIIWEIEVFYYSSGGYLRSEGLFLDVLVFFHERYFLGKVLVAVLERLYYFMG
jgi:hypothetical protein